MVPVGLGAWLVVLLFPLMIAAGLVFPLYVVWRYRHLRIHGQGQMFIVIKKRFAIITLVLGGALYVLLTLSFFAPHVVPAFHSLAETGYLAFVVPIIFLDLLLNAVLSPGRALSRRP